ncbi:hypothetical protein TVAG_335840 [Trichomonas vaginalis G3]|uniref:Uncharacterized protein n=1 Tax=Trichomonas vaginalis (strain ATCC PRA-98 / G3) TaxID=412133 RepID=A2FQ87_TRIV3|nr:hypothetical protein TVAGG3_0713710 [Trichomonas vaginalis G3]EAX92922.1 hypothetical protein TVAG_335840 [Trichomonas vaginalis G3]KAI5510103.1 hypothetical protein TVAGG3_0713710 [Trichomonas vaginalis G3]|eukprot:XP_001305852.1 hypothetical protein [Trichomonas vaginalis G3]
MNGCHPNEEVQIMEDPEYEYYDLVCHSRYNQFEIFIPDFVLDYLKTVEYPKCYKYRGLSAHSYSPYLVPFTKGIDLTDEDFDSLARISIHTFLNEYNVNNPILRLEQLCSISVEIEFFVLPFLSKPSVNAPKDIIKFMEIFSKQARVKEDFQYYFANPYIDKIEPKINGRRARCLPLYDYSQLETDNPFKKVLDYRKSFHLEDKPDYYVNDESNIQLDSQVQDEFNKLTDSSGKSKDNKQSNPPGKDESNNQLDSKVKYESNKPLDLTGKSKDNKPTDFTQKTQCIEPITIKTNYQTNKTVRSIRKDQSTDSIDRHQNHFCNIA